MPTRCQFMFRHPAGYGWSEVYTSQFTYSQTVNGPVQALIAARLAILSSDCEFQRVRLATGAYRAPFDLPVSTPGVPNGALDGPAAQDFTRLLCQLVANDTSGRIFLGGIPQDWATGDSLTWPVPAQKAFQPFAAILSATGAAWQVITTNTGGPKTKYAVNGATPLMPRGWRFTNPTFALTAGQMIRVSQSSVIGYNGLKTVEFVDGTSLPQSVIVGGASPATAALTTDAVYFTVQSPSYTSIADVFPIRIVHRKAGRPFGLRPGRQRNSVALRR
jgi:hypothetical protein